MLSCYDLLHLYSVCLGKQNPVHPSIWRVGGGGGWDGLCWEQLCVAWKPSMSEGHGDEGDEAVTETLVGPDDPWPH